MNDSTPRQLVLATDPMIFPVDTGMQHGPAITLRSCEVYNASGQIIARKIWRWLAQSPDAKAAQDRCCQHRAARLMANLNGARKTHVVGIDFERWYVASSPIAGGAQSEVAA